MQNFPLGKCGFAEIRTFCGKMSISMHIFYFTIGVIKTKPPALQGDSLKQRYFSVPNNYLNKKKKKETDQVMRELLFQSQVW